MQMISQNLTIRPCAEKDAPFILQLVNQPSWIQYIGDREIHTVLDAKNYIRERLAAHVSEFGYGFFLVERSRDEVPVGICGIINRVGLINPDLGFAVLSEFEGKGYMSEAAEIILDVVPKVFKLRTIDAITSPENSKSIHLLKRLGFNLEPEKIQLQDEPESLLLFRKSII